MEQKLSLKKNKEPSDCPAPLEISCLKEDSFLPLVITQNACAAEVISFKDLLVWIKKHKPWLKNVLSTYGGLLFRGFPILTSEDFEDFVLAIDPNLTAYTQGQSQRHRVKNLIYTSTEYPADQNITLHNELSYTDHPPGKIFFFCETPPLEGGETPIADCRTIYQRLNANLKEKFIANQVCYVKNMHGSAGFGKSWQDHFETTNKDEVEAYLKQANVDFSWQEDGSLRTTQTRSAVIQHPETQESVWHSQAHLWHFSNYGAQGEMLLKVLGEARLPTNAYYGDGTPIPADVIQATNQAFWEEASFFDWQKGDLLMLDNLLVAHGRTSFTGPRRILVAMTD
jgi:hypothetical protein